MLPLHIGAIDGHVRKVNDVLVKAYVFAALKKRRTAIDKFGFPVSHRLCACLRTEDTAIVLVGQFTPEVFMVTFLVDLLQTYNVSVVFPDFVQDEVFAIIPRQDIRGRVPIELRGSISLAEDVISENGKRFGGFCVVQYMPVTLIRRRTGCSDVRS